MRFIIISSCAEIVVEVMCLQNKLEIFWTEITLCTDGGCLEAFRHRLFEDKVGIEHRPHEIVLKMALFDIKTRRATANWSFSGGGLVFAAVYLLPGSPQFYAGWNVPKSLGWLHRWRMALCRDFTASLEATVGSRESRASFNVALEMSREQMIWFKGGNSLKIFRQS